MWAQFIKARIKPGREDEARRIAQEFEAQSRTEGIGPLRVSIFHNQRDPQEHYTVAFFESEEQARAAESNPRHAELIRRYWEVYEGPPEYADLGLFLEWSR